MPFLSYIVAIFCLAGATYCLKALARGVALRSIRGRFLLLNIKPAREFPIGPLALSWLPDGLARRFARAGMEPSRPMIQIAVLIWSALCLTLIATMGIAAGALSGSTVILLAWAYLEYCGATNMRRLADAMLGLLERMRQLLSVGNSLPIALERAVENSPPIVKQHLAPVLRRIGNGSGVAESISRCAAELDLYELELLATASRTNMRFGGSMSSTLRNMIETIRKRNSIERELRANTTQVRASAWVLALLPMVVASLVTLTNRDYSRWFLATERGHWMIAYAAGSQLIGIFCMRIIVRTRY